MKQNIALALYYNQPNRNSFNALIGAIGTDARFKDLDIFFLDNEKELISKISGIENTHEKTIIAISFLTTQLWETKKLISRLKKKLNTRPLYIAGGPHPTGDPKGTLSLGFDIAIIGEGEETFIELLKNIDSGSDYTTMKGIAYADNEGTHHINAKRPPIDLDRYPSFAARHNRFGPIEITRGCPFACYFCETPRIFGSTIRHRSIENICTHARTMIDCNRYDIRLISPNAFSYGSKDGRKLNIKKLKDLLKRIKDTIKPKGRLYIGSFPSEVRPEHVTEETIALVKKYADNDNIIIGAESGSQKLLDLCHRGHTVEDIYRAVDLTTKAGLKANVDFIFGLPEESVEDIKDTIKVMNDLISKGAKIHAHAFIPL
ncbi:MAG: TIGR04013 family B12-binding domain/radical SAM domain-containing protein, partial [archaeon]